MGGGGVRQMLTLAEKGARGVWLMLKSGEEGSIPKTIVLVNLILSLFLLLRSAFKVT